MFGSEQIQSVSFVIDVDPTDNQPFYLMKAPLPLTVISAYGTSKAADNAGTARLLSLQNWGTAGTAVEGTVAAAIGGTASAARFAANTPKAATITAAEAYVGEGEWLVVHFGEEGSGWQSGDRLTYHVDYIVGKVG